MKSVEEIWGMLPHNTYLFKWESIDILEKWEQNIREDQRNLCEEDAIFELTHEVDDDLVTAVSIAILNAGKGEKEDE